MNVIFVPSTQIKLPSKLLIANTLIMIRYSDPMPTHCLNVIAKRGQFKSHLINCCNSSWINKNVTYTNGPCQWKVVRKYI